MKHILLVEDDLSLLNGLSFALKKQGYALEIARTKDEQKQLWAEDKYELLLGPGAAEHYQIQTGDTVTVNGTDLKITCAFLEGVFSDDVTIICPEALFHRLMGAEDYNLVGVQLNADADSQTDPVPSDHREHQRALTLISECLQSGRKT